MSRYTPEFNAYARRVVKSFNQRVMRAEKRGLKNLPSLRSVRELKAQFNTEDDLKKELASLREFNENRNALDQKMLGEEARLTTWEFNYIKENMADVRDFYKRVLERTRKRYENNPFDMAIRNDVLNLEERVQYLNRDVLELTKSELATFRKYLNRYKNRNRTDQNFYDFYYESFDFLGRVAGVDENKMNYMKQQINSLTPEEFYEFYKQNTEMKDILKYVPSPERAKYYAKIRKLEEEKKNYFEETGHDADIVKDKIETFYGSKQEFDKKIQKAKEAVK